MARALKKLFFTTVLKEDIKWELEGGIDKAIAYLTSLKNDNVSKELTVVCSSSYREDGSWNLSIEYQRQETDEEYNMRVASCLADFQIKKQQQEQTEVLERAEYDRLRKKYGEA